MSTEGDNSIARGLLDVYAAAFPARARVRVVTAEALATDGWESDLYACDVAYEEDSELRGDAAILKLYYGEAGCAKAAREFGALRSLTSAGYPVPRALAHSGDAAPFGRPFVLMERIAGRSLRTALAQTNGAEWQRLRTLFVRLFVELHALDWRPFVPDPDAYGAQTLLPAWIASAAQGIVAEPRATRLFAPALVWLQERAPGVACERLSVVHWDYHPDNVLLRPDGALVVIDWTGSQVADYRMDLAWTLLHVSTNGHPERRELLLNDYARLAGQPVEDIACFEVIACIRRLLDAMRTLGGGATTANMRPEAEAAIRANGAHLRSVLALLQARIGQPLPDLERTFSSL